MGKIKRPETREVAELKARLAEAEEALRAIRGGEVDALVVSTSQGDKVFTITGADAPYRLLVEAMNEGALLLLPDGTILFGNTHFAALAKTPLEQINGASWERFFPPEEQLRLTALLKAAQTEGNRGEFSLLAGDGSRRPVQLSLRLMKADGMEGITVIVTDLAERKAQEEALRQAKAELEARVRERTSELAATNEHLRESEARYRLLFEQNADGIFALDTAGRFIVANPACETISGYPAAELSQKTFQELCVPDQLAQTTAAFEQTLRDGSPRRIQTAFVHKDGRRVELSVTGGPVMQNGKLTSIYCTARDITERKRAEEERERLRIERQQQQEFLEKLIENAPIGVAVVGRDLRYLLANPAYRVIAGPANTPVAGRTIAEVFPPEVAQIVEPFVQQVFQSGQPLHIPDYEAPVRGRTWWNVSEIPLRGATGEVDAVMILTEEVTERKRAEVELAKAKDRLEHTLNSITDGYYALDSDWRFVSVNARTEEHFGRPASVLLGQSIWELTATPVDSALYQRFAEARATGQPRHFEAKSRVRPSFWAHLHLYPRDGVLEVYYADISERKKAEEALRESERQFRIMGETVPYGVWLCAPDGGVRYCSQSFLDLINMTQEEQQQFGWTRRLVPEDVEPMMKKWLDCCATGTPWEHEHRIFDRHGKVRTVLSKGLPVRDAEGKITCWTGVNLDITERKWAEEQLRQTKEQLAHANEDLERTVQERTARLQELVAELEHFSYSIVHDMRAPLRSMNSFAAIMTEECAGCLKPANRDYLRRISNAAKRMDQLITDALQYSQMVRSELRLVPVDVEALLRGMMETYPALRAPGVDIRLEGPLPKVLGNEAYLTQCCSNLLDNAVKFVAPGVAPRVRIWAERSERENIEHSTLNIEHRSGDAAPSISHQPSTINSLRTEERSGAENTEHPTLNIQHRNVDAAPSINYQPSTLNSFVRLWFEDNGIGIPEQGRHRLFGMFQRFHSGYEGTGIGLAIVRKVAERLGGRVGVESQAGQGSRFWLDLKPAVD